MFWVFMCKIYVIKSEKDMCYVVIWYVMYVFGFLGCIVVVYFIVNVILLDGILMGYENK